MPAISILLEGDQAWPELKGADGYALPSVVEGDLVGVAYLPGGMQSGKASIVFRIELGDGRTVVAQTSAELFQAAARAFEGRRQYLEELKARGGKES